MKSSIVLGSVLGVCVLVGAVGYGVYEAKESLKQAGMEKYVCDKRGCMLPPSGGSKGEGTVSIKDNAVIYTLVTNKSKSPKEADLYLSTDILDTENYLSLPNDLKEFDKDSTIRLHLAGNGGFVEGYLYIVNVLKATGAKVIPVVDGSIASAHAFLALSFNILPSFTNNMGYIFFHTTSSTNEAENLCRNVIGTDRGYPAKAKCIEDTITRSNIYNNYVYHTVFRYLTADELARMSQGRDVIIPFEEFKKRLGQ